MKKRIYCGGYTSKGAKGIYLIENKELILKAEIENPTYITQQGQHLYALFGGEHGCGMADYKILENGDLELHQKVNSTETKGACHIVVNQKQDIVMTSNYHEHCFNFYKKENGEWQTPIKVILDEEKSRIHHIYYSELRELFYVTDLGCDKIYVFDPKNLEAPLRTIDFPEKSGVRHTIFNKDESLMFVVSEYSGEIFVLKDDVIVSSILTNPNHEFNESMAAIRFCKDERFLCVSGRTHHEIIVYEIVGEALVEHQRFATEGQHPRDFNLVDDGLICANLDTNNLVFFEVDDKGYYHFEDQIEAPALTCVSLS